MDSWIFKVARKICIIAFGANIFIHAVIGASAAIGIVKGALSMSAMLGLLVLLSWSDLKRRINGSRRKRQDARRPRPVEKKKEKMTDPGIPRISSMVGVQENG